jgi:hypothetical protein
MRKASRPATLATPAMLQLLRAIAALTPRLHEPNASTNSDTLYTLFCEMMRGLGLFALIASETPPARCVSSPPASKTGRSPRCVLQ